jgi:hypothetical protein
MKKKDPDLEKLDKVLSELRKKLERDHEWQASVGQREADWLKKASEALEKLKPPQDEMLLDIIEADLKIEYGLGDLEILIRKKEEVVSALWKLLQITKWLRGEKVRALDRLKEGG